MAKQQQVRLYAPTRPRLQSVNHDFSDLNEQLRQVAHIIGLSDDWTSIQDEHARSNALRHLVCARAEWVLRWVLDKLKDEGDAGVEARRNATAWTLLDWMVHTLPISRSAPHLRDARFPSVLERVLFENFELDADKQAVPATQDMHMRDATDSSETIADDSQPSRKRKRGTAEPSPSKRTAVSSVDPKKLFEAVKAVLQSIQSCASQHDTAASSAQAELMKMVLRTESAQAARILRFWFAAVHRICSSNLQLQDSNVFDLSLIMEIWELRIVDAGDETASSSEDFNTECLVPTLQLATLLKETHTQLTSHPPMKAIATASQILDKLLTRHLFAPARAAFLASSATSNESGNLRQSAALSSSLQPLRAKLLQAAQLEDANEAVPLQLQTLYYAVPQLLELAIRASPAKTPKYRVMERPWLEAVLVSLAECVGCSLKEAPEYVTPKLATVALDRILSVLNTHAVTVRSDTLRTLFWYYSGLEYPRQGQRTINWSLIAALIELDPTLFTTESNSKLEFTEKHHKDLADVVFQTITDMDQTEPGFKISFSENTNKSEDTELPMDLAGKTETTAEFIIVHIIVPLVSAFARNRNLLGFFRRWDEQLITSYKSETRKVPNETHKSIWEDRIIATSLTELLEQSLTQGQIAKLMQEHADRIKAFCASVSAEAAEHVKVGKVAGYKKAASSAVIVPAILQSVQSDETISVIEPQLHSLLMSYSTWVQNECYRAYTQREVSWLTLCLLMSKLWPADLHGSSKLQQSFLRPLVEQASQEMSAGSASKKGRPDGSATRAAAILFSLNACDWLSTLPGSQEIVTAGFDSITKSLAPKYLEHKDQTKMLELLCTQFIHLVAYLDDKKIQAALKDLFVMLSRLDSQIRERIGRSLSQAIFNTCAPGLQNIYVSVLTEALNQGNAVSAFNVIQPSALTREQREAVLDRITSLLSKAPADLDLLLSTSVKLMELPSASANISKDGNIMFLIADQICGEESPSPTTLEQLQCLVRRVLEHMIPNREQAQSKTYLKSYSKNIDMITKGVTPCTAPRLAILRATILEQKDANILNIKQYAKVLKQSLQHDEDNDGTASIQDILDAFNELPMFYLQDAAFFAECQSWLRSWIKENADLETYLTIPGQSPVELAEYVGRLHTTVAKFKLYPDLKWFVNFTIKVVHEPLSDHLKRKVHATTTNLLATLETHEKLELVSVLTKATEAHETISRATCYRILANLTSTLSDKLTDKPESKHKQLALLPRFCTLLAEVPNDACFNALLDSIDIILNNKPNHVTQHGFECVLSILSKLSSRTCPTLSVDHASETYARICETSRLILLVHRNRLGGRLHLLLPLLQNLLFCLFVPNSGRSGALPIWLRTTSTGQPLRLAPHNAAQYARVLSTLCNPPQSSISKSHQNSRNSKDLNDPVKAAREKTSHFLYPLLASFCRLQLAGRLTPEVRKKLMPGIWDVLGTASLRREGLDAMFAGLGKSERDVWRGVWTEYESIHGRKEVHVAKDVAEDI